MNHFLAELSPLWLGTDIFAKSTLKLESGLRWYSNYRPLKASNMSEMMRIVLRVLLYAALGQRFVLR